MFRADLYDVVLGVAVVRPDPLLEEHAQREVLLEEGQHVLDRDAADRNPDSSNPQLEKLQFQINAFITLT